MVMPGFSVWLKQQQENTLKSLLVNRSYRKKCGACAENVNILVKLVT